MRALVWLREETWEAVVDAAGRLLPPGAEVTLLHVADAEAEAAAQRPAAGLLGRPRPRPPKPPPHRTLEALSDEAAAALVADAQSRLGRPARTLTRRGRLEREVLEAAGGHDLLILARDGDAARPGPHSLGPAARFVVDHAPCAVVLVWPDSVADPQAPGVR